MIKNLCLKFAVLLCAATSFAQSASSKKRLFADTGPIILKYRADSQKAWDANNEKQALSYSDSIKLCIVGSYVSNHKFKTIDSRTIEIASKKPVLVTVSADWCKPCLAEISALNKIAEEYKDKVDFVVLFWNDAAHTKEIASRYEKSIYIVPSAAQTNENDGFSISIAGFKHFTGYPTNYMINTNREIVKYEGGAQVAGTSPGRDGKMITVTEEQANSFNYKRLKADVEYLLAHRDK